MGQEERRKYLLEVIENSHIITTSELAKKACVSNETIRRDLGTLEREGLVAKIHGGVVAIKRKGGEVPYKRRAIERIKEKQAIANEAYKQINKNDSLVLDGGTTTFELAKLLVDREDLFIITPSISIGNYLITNSKCKVFLTGGWVRRHDLMMYGNASIETIEKFHVDKAFVGGAGISHIYGLTDYFDEEVNLRKSIIKSSDERILLVDNSKINNIALITVSPISVFNTIITDDKANIEDINMIRGEGVEVIVAKINRKQSGNMSR